MKLEVIGMAISRRRRAKPSTASIRQVTVVAAVLQHPGANINVLEEIVDYADKGCLERALQGLIRKGYLTWELNKITKRLKYYVTREGEQWLEACKQQTGLSG